MTEPEDKLAFERSLLLGAVVVGVITPEEKPKPQADLPFRLGKERADA